VLLFRLARIAMAAEELRLRHLIRRAIVRVVFAWLAAVLFLGALAFAHIAAWAWLRMTMVPYQACLILGGVDLVLGVVLMLLACRSSPGRVEREARAVRERAVDEALESLTISALLLRVVDMVIAPRP
jgi:hypothetical protein